MACDAVECLESCIESAQEVLRELIEDLEVDMQNTDEDDYVYDSF